MRVYGEAYLFINFWLDFLSLLIAARLRRAYFHRARAIAGAFAGAVYALIAWNGGSLLRGFPALFASMLSVTLISFGKRGVSLFPWVAASMLLLSGLADMMLKNGASPALALVMCGISSLGVCALQSRRSSAQESFGELILAYRGNRVKLFALRDSGNLLTDGVTGLPVIVAPEKGVASLLPAGVLPSNPSTLPSGWRLLPIRTAAGNGMLMCFRADRAEMRRNGKTLPIDAVIAVSAFSEKAALVPDVFFD